MIPIAHSHFNAIESYVPGLAEVEGKRQAIKLSSNENALGASPKAIAAYRDHAEKIFRYADGACIKLREALAKKMESMPWN